MLRKFLISGFVLSITTLFIILALLIFSPDIIDRLERTHEAIYVFTMGGSIIGMFLFILLLAGTSDPITQNVCVVEYVRVVENDKEN